MEVIKIKFKNKIYNIDREAVEHVLSHLNYQNNIKLKEEEVIKLLEERALLNEGFLENINSLRT